MRAPMVRQYSGFTLVEMLAVIVLLGILAAYAAPKIFDNTSFQTRGFYEELRSALRYAQKTAVASGCRVTFSTANSNGSYSAVFPNNACGTGTAIIAVPGFNGGALKGKAPSHISLPNASITFTPAGQASADTTFTIGTHTIRVYSTTGYIAGT